MPSPRLLALLAIIGTTVLSFPALAGDPAAGERVYKAQCSACHAIEPGKNRVGPSLAGLVGRQSGAVEGFRYSNANRNANLIWTPEILDRYLINPRVVIPGTIMAYAGLRNDKQRADLVSYLETLK
ncbi:Cytochrome c2 [Rhodovastum atsumiense]|uniref:Cytochrome c family protein n=1 Tax=Rhodovastum atsumiense TaxID=504468 RepID=A0A5M6IRQ0_9PROT|nr:cytochrome c family protein [Rhodovastum atsumiense]KAA5610577.1 cytochrome c family protein [Rhodovastum atsumiense]CAH2600688.1 Cytochrome c2 [Rhodovastum atsumiense]